MSEKWPLEVRKAAQRLEFARAAYEGWQMGNAPKTEPERTLALQEGRKLAADVDKAQGQLNAILRSLELMP